MPRLRSRVRTSCVAPNKRKPDQKWSGFLLSGGCEEGEPRAQAGRVAPNKKSPIRNGRVFCYPAHAKSANLVPKLVASLQTRKARSEMVGFFAIWHMRRGRTSCPSWSRRSKQEKLDQKWSGFLLSDTCEEGEPRAQAGRVAPNKKSLIRNGRAFCYLAHAKRANLVPKLVASLQTRKARSEMVGFFAIWHMRRGRTSCPSWSRRSKQEKPDQKWSGFLLSGIYYLIWLPAHCNFTA